MENPGYINLETIFKSGHLPDDFRRFIIESQKIAVLIQILPEIFHKLKNKMTPILGYTQLLSLKAENDGTKERLSRIEKNTEELGFLLDQLSRYFRKGEIIRFKININDVIWQLKSYFIEIERINRIKIGLDLDENIQDDYLILGQIEDLIINIVDNAVQAIKKRNFGSSGESCAQPEPASILIKTQSGRDHYKLVIKDNGFGIKKESLSKIWVPFYSEFDQKPGLGLLICEKIVKNHDALIKIISQEGIGTEFEITFKYKI